MLPVFVDCRLLFTGLQIRLMQETCERIVEFESSRHGKNRAQLPTRTQSYFLSFRRGEREGT